MNEAIHTIMTHSPITLTGQHTVADVNLLFRNHRIHHIPVVDGDKLVGLVTSYDLWNKTQGESDDLKVANVMNKQIVKISSNDKIGTAAELFLDNRFHALPVVDDGKLVGIVTTFDVLKYEFKKEYSKIILYKDVFEQKADRLSA